MLTRSKPMNRGSGFKRPTLERVRSAVVPIPADVAARIAYRAAELNPAPKADVVRHEGYRRLVAAMACRRCRIFGHGQAAHPNADKGMAMKADDRLCFSLCADRPGVRGCHSLFDQGAVYAKDARRDLEVRWGLETRRHLQAAGIWPADLPAWPADQMEKTDDDNAR